MKKLILITLSFSLLSLISFAQVNDTTWGNESVWTKHKKTKKAKSTKDTVKVQRFCIGFSAGYGIPAETYGPGALVNNNKPDELPMPTNNTLWANPGFHFDANATINISKSWGLMFQYGGNMNPYNTEYYSGDGSYYFQSLLAGLAWSYNDKRGNALQIGLLGGEIELNERATSIAETQNITSVQFQGWGAELGVKYKFHLSKALFFTIDVAYTHAQTNPAALPPNADIGDLLILNSPIGILNAGVGLEVRF